MSLLRFLMLLSLVVWLGGVILFAVLAPMAFSVLPSRHLAGSMVGAMLSRLNWMGIASAIVFLGSSMAYARVTTREAHPLAARHILVGLMLILTVISQFGISPKMAALRASMGEIDSVPPARMEFNTLHVWSTRLEVGVLLLGLAVVYLMASLNSQR